MENKNLFGYIDNVELDEKMKKSMINPQPDAPVQIHDGRSFYWKNFAALGGAAAVICAFVVGGYIFLGNGEAPALSEGAYETEDGTLDETTIDADITPDYPTWQTQPHEFILEATSVVIEIDEPAISEFVPPLTEGQIEHYYDLYFSARNRAYDNEFGLGVYPYFAEEADCTSIYNFAYYSERVLDGTMSMISVNFPEVTYKEWERWRDSLRSYSEMEYPKLSYPDTAELYRALNDLRVAQKLGIAGFMFLDYNEYITKDDESLRYYKIVDMEAGREAWLDFVNNLFTNAAPFQSIDYISLDNPDYFIEQDGEIYMCQVSMTEEGWVYYTIGEEINGEQWVYNASLMELYKLVSQDGMWKIDKIVGNEGATQSGFWQDENGDWHFPKG